MKVEGQLEWLFKGLGNALSMCAWAESVAQSQWWGPGWWGPGWWGPLWGQSSERVDHPDCLM